MKLIIKNGRVAATVSDSYQGPESTIPAPNNFDATLIDTYRYINGSLSVMVPEKVTMRQARLILHRRGLLNEVNTILNTVPGNEGIEARIEWDTSESVSINSPLVAYVAEHLGLNRSELESLFIDASKIE